jgi:hypothetical protein
MTVELTIDVRSIETALHNVGASDVRIPPDWDGKQLRVEVGPMVAASYPEDVTVLQARPIELSLPSGFPLERFTEVTFRNIGVSPWEARALAKTFVANLSWFLDIPVDEVANIQEVPLRTGSALLIEDFDDEGGLERATVLLSRSDRIYCVSAKSRELGLRVADALP